MSLEEKGGAGTPSDKEAPPAFAAGQSARDQEDFLTRNGLNLRSFQKRDMGAGSIDSLDRSMRTRHMHMIAVGGSIGAGFFVGSGKALNTGGPATLLIDFAIIGVMMFNTSSPSCIPSLEASTRTRPASSIRPGVSPWAGTTSCNGPSSCRSNSRFAP
jgi:hypothetical protein